MVGIYIHIDASFEKDVHVVLHKLVCWYVVRSVCRSVGIPHLLQLIIQEHVDQEAKNLVGK